MKNAVIFLLVFLFFSSFTPAQKNIIFNHLTVDDGLSQSSVTCIYQDKKGFIWLGTQDGLNRYDGYTLKLFKNTPGDSTTISDNFIFGIYETENGTLFIETQTGNINRYNPLSETFSPAEKGEINIQTSRYNSILAFLEEQDGVKWTGGLSKPVGLTRTDTKSGKTITYKHKPEDPSSISDDKVYSIFRDSKGNLWVGTMKGLDRLDELTGRFFHYRHNPSDPSTLPDNWIWPIYEDSKGNIWIGTVRGGLAKFHPESGTFTRYVPNPNNPASINDNYIYSIFEDRSGVIWVGTNTGGVNYFNPAAQVFEQYNHDPLNRNSITDDNIVALYVDREGNYWVGTREGGVDRIDDKTGLYKNYSEKSPYNLISNSVQVIYEDRGGTFWLGTFSSGLMEFNPATGKYKLHVNIPSDPNSLSDNRIYSVTEDRYGYIWIGTYGGGVNKLDRKTGKAVRYLHDEANPNTLGGNSAWSIAEDNEGNIWVGTFGSGISVLNPETSQFKHYKNNPADLSSLGDNSILRIYMDSRNNIWVGHTGGLSRYIKESGIFKNYNENDGLCNNFVFGILEDASGNIWLSTNNGLSKFNFSDESFTNYYAQDGLQGNEFNQNAFAKNPKTGELLFGGPQGFNVFDPEKIKPNSYLPPIVFTDYLRYNTDDEEGKPIVEKGISIRDSILLTFKDNIITLKFAALSYYNSHMNEYKYKLEGFNENWIQLGNNRTVTFTNLSPGEYILHVIGSNNDGVWNEAGSNLFIEVLPPWWRSTYAYISYVIIFIGILLGARKIELDRREQKALIRETELRMKATEAEKRAIQIENDRKTKELEEARQLQLSMLPKEVPKLPHLDIAAFMRTATEVGGDYYDFLINNGTLNVGFGDATGHGLQAGTMVTLMKGFFTSDAAKLELQDFMNHCSSLIKEIKLGRILMSFSLMRIQDQKLSVTSAGMPPLYLFNSSNGEVEEIMIQGIPLGAMRKFTYRTVEKELKSGDTILLLTDGLPEQMNKTEQMYDYSRVKQTFQETAFKTPDEIIQALVKSGDEWMDGAVQSDDISFVVIKAK